MPEVNTYYLITFKEIFIYLYFIIFKNNKITNTN